MSPLRGRVAKDTGDGVMATVDTASDVLALSGVVQQSLNVGDAWGRSRSRGRALPEVHANPRRLLHSLRRRADGSHEQISHEDAVAEIADRLRDVVDRYGPNAVAIYIGTSSAAYPAMGSIAASMLTALGSK